ncbi:uncharacterized protein ACNS7B_020909 isoform 3-T5 [Menidia menidia]
MKTLCWTPLLLILSPCVCAAAFGVNVTQRHYQAEETHSITLEWTFTTHPHRPWTVLMAYCELRTEHNSSLLTEFSHDGDELEEFVGEQFLGRVQMDREALREGRISLHVSRLRTEDSGWYLCEVETDQGFGSESCRLNVTAAADHPEPQRPSRGPKPEGPGSEGPGPGNQDRRSRIGLYISLAVVAAALLIVLMLRLHFIKASNKATENKSDVQEMSKLNQPTTDLVSV